MRLRVLLKRIKGRIGGRGGGCGVHERPKIIGQFELRKTPVDKTGMTFGHNFKPTFLNLPFTLRLHANQIADHRLHRRWW